MQCPNCGTIATAGDRFCEECGTSLVANSANLSNSTAGCEKCGAGPEEIDAEGFCSNCGFRREAPQGDRIEVTLQANQGGVTDRGLRHHRNEDYFAVQKVDGRNAYVLVVCDGVSSSLDPDKAAKAAAVSACMALSAAVQKGEIELEKAMKAAIGEAQASVCAIPYTRGTDEDAPSTTIVAAVVIDRTATIGWLGDSRAYWISPNGSRQLTRDDSWLFDVVASGKMTEAEARKSPHAHAITRWLGADAGDDSQPSVVKFDIPGSGHLLLCTDGLWNYAPEPAQIASLVKQMSDADAVTVSRSLADFARRSGGHDNITVAILSL